MVRNGAECCKKIYVKIFVTHLFLTQVCYGLHIDKHVSVLMPIENFTLTYIKSTKTKAKLQKKRWPGVTGSKQIIQVGDPHQ